jgi:acyl-CoA synthetase (AMP-forming)/AMP-acid ligase II
MASTASGSTTAAQPATGAGAATDPWPRSGGVNRTELDPVAFLERSAAVHTDRTAVVHGDLRRTYGELHARVRRLASALRGRGVQPGDRVAALLPNTPAMLEAHFGVPAAGAVLVAINIRLGPAEIRGILEHSGARFLLVDHELAHLVSDPPSGLEVVRVDDTAAPEDPYEQLLAEGDPGAPPRALADEETPLSINYTSGTTGAPKGVVYTHRGAYLNALGEIVETELGHHPVYLWTLPMFHCNGWCFPWAVTAAGGTHVCLRAVDPELVWRLLRDEGVTHYNASPTVQIALVNHPAAAPLERPVTATVAGAPPSPTLLQRMAELSIRVVHVYGLTETYGPHTVNIEPAGLGDRPPEERSRLLARQGQGYTTADLVRVVDDDMNDVRRDGETMGEVVMRGNNVMAGYFAAPELTAEAFAGGWFHSGDLAVWHPDDAIELRDRGKDVIISGGENISTIEVEQAVCSHPAVLECAVVSMPHDRWGERPKAFVTLKEGATVGERELIDYCRERIAHYKVPDAVEFGPLPKTSTGKVQKFQLREREWGGRERRIN